MSSPNIPILQPHESVALLTKQHIEEARDHNVKVKAAKTPKKLSFDAIPGHKAHPPILDFSSIDGHILR